MNPIQKSVDLTEVLKQHLDETPEQIINRLINIGIPTDEIIMLLTAIGNQMNLQWDDMNDLIPQIVNSIKQVKKTFVGGFIWAVIAKWAALSFADGRISLDDLPRLIQAFWEEKYNQK